MPTMGEVIARVDRAAVNVVPEEEKCRWLSALDGQVALEPLGVEPVSYSWPGDRDAALLIPIPWDGVYDLYLRAMLHDAQGEAAEYNSLMAAFNEALGEYLRYIRRTNVPPRTGQFIL